MPRRSSPTWACTGRSRAPSETRLTGDRTGGLAGNAAFAYSSEVYDAGVWTDAEDPALGGQGAIMAALGPNGGAYYIGRYDHTSTLLPSGQVLIAGGHFNGKLDRPRLASRLAACRPIPRQTARRG